MISQKINTLPTVYSSQEYQFYMKDKQHKQDVTLNQSKMYYKKDVLITCGGKHTIV